MPKFRTPTAYGKVLFAACDIMAAMLMMVENEHLSTASVALWLFSPFTATISTRGNGEALVVCMLMGMLVLLQKNRLVPAAVLYGLAVHWRIFPIIYAPSILLYLSATHGAKYPYVSRQGLMFGLLSGAVFLVLGGVMHAMYGMEFLEETYLYHVTRVDPRHNFSPYFYPAYLGMAGGSGGGHPGAGSYDTGSLFSLVGLAMQLMVAHSTMRSSNDLAMAFLAQSMAFVTFNKVSTAQYFVWYLCWFCLRLDVAVARIGSRWLVAWPLALGHWLLWAYLLEFRGMPVHAFVWMAGLVFLGVNTAILRSLVRSA